MQGKIAITAENEIIKYDIRLRHRISILTGDSGTGKTSLANFESDTWSDFTVLDGKGSKLRYMRLVNLELLDSKNKFSNYLIIIDEEEFITAASMGDKFDRFLNENNESYVLIISRDIGTCSINTRQTEIQRKLIEIINTKHYPISVDAIYYLHTKKHGNKAYTTNIGLVGNENGRFVGQSGRCLTEDTRLGRETVQLVLRDKQAIVIDEPIGGKAKIIDRAIQYYDGDKKLNTIVVDGAVFAVEFFYLEMIKRASNKNVIAYMPISFEYCLLKNKFINKAMQNITYRDVVNKAINGFSINKTSKYTVLVSIIRKSSYKSSVQSLADIFEHYENFANEEYSLEQFFTLLLSVVTFEMYGKGYNKTNLPCIKYQCANCTEKEHCKFFGKLGNLRQRYQDLMDVYSGLRRLFLDKKQEE